MILAVPSTGYTSAAGKPEGRVRSLRYGKNSALHVLAPGPRRRLRELGTAERPRRHLHTPLVDVHPGTRDPGHQVQPVGRAEDGEHPPSDPAPGGHAIASLNSSAGSSGLRPSARARSASSSTSSARAALARDRFATTTAPPTAVHAHQALGAKALVGPEHCVHVRFQPSWELPGRGAVTGTNGSVGYRPSKTDGDLFEQREAALGVSSYQHSSTCTRTLLRGQACPPSACRQNPIASRRALLRAGTAPRHSQGSTFGVSEKLVNLGKCRKPVAGLLK